MAGGDALVLLDDDGAALSVMSKRATSPFRRSATNSELRANVHQAEVVEHEEVGQDLLGFSPMDLSRMVTGILRRRSTRK